MTAPVPAAARADSSPPLRPPVPVRTIAAAIGMVLTTVVAVLVIARVERVLVWLVVAAFLATALWPLVGAVERRTRLPRSVAVLLVFLVGAVLLSGVVALFVAPLVTQGSDFVAKLPDYVAQARQGRGPVGDLVTRFHLDTVLQRNEARLRAGATGLGSTAGHVLGVVVSTVAGVVSVLVLTFLMLLQGPQLLAGALNALPEARRKRVEHVGRDCAHAVTGYMAGNLFISVICGVLTFAALALLGVPFAGVIALFVAVTDLIPLVGATIGAIAATGVAFLHSVPAGIGVIVFFVLYQQLENHLLQPLVLSRTVKINALAVLVSVLVGVELAGILGALVAIPVAGMIQVLVRDVYDHRRGRLKDTPTTGEDRVPVDGAGGGDDGGSRATGDRDAPGAGGARAAGDRGAPGAGGAGAADDRGAGADAGAGGLGAGPDEERTGPRPHRVLARDGAARAAVGPGEQPHPDEVHDPTQVLPRP